MSEQLQLDLASTGLQSQESRWERGERERIESLALDPAAGELGAERNLVYPGPRGERGFPICETEGCRRESCGPYSYACSGHWRAAIDDRPAPVTQLRELPGTEWEHIFGMAAPGDASDEPLTRSNGPEEG